MESTEAEYDRHTRQAQREGLFYLIVVLVSAMAGLILRMHSTR